MADKSISQLSAATYINDNDLLVMQQGSGAVSVSGKLLKSLVGSIVIKGHVDAVADLPTDATSGDAYSVGTATPYNIYIYTDGAWLDYGQMGVTSDALALKQDVANMVTTISSDSDNDHYPTANAVYRYTMAYGWTDDGGASTRFTQPGTYHWYDTTGEIATNGHFLLTVDALNAVNYRFTAIRLSSGTAGQEIVYYRSCNGGTWSPWIRQGKTQLWKNSDASAEFAAQAVTLSTSPAYFDAIVVQFQLMTTNGTHLDDCYCATDHATIWGTLHTMGYVNYQCQRSFNIKSATTAEFSDCTRITFSSSKNTIETLNTWAIPNAIYGIKY